MDEIEQAKQQFEAIKARLDDYAALDEPTLKQTQEAINTLAGLVLALAENRLFERGVEL